MNPEGDAHAGLFAVPVRWFLIRDPEGEFKPQALLYTNLESVDGFDYPKNCPGTVGAVLAHDLVRPTADGAGSGSS
jgi:hypothetical protein